MKIFLLSIADSAGQHATLAKAFREHLGWDAKSCVMKETYLGYHTDFVMERDRTKIEEYIKGADWFILQDYRLDLGLGLADICTRKNTIVNTYGTLARNNLSVLHNLQLEGWNIMALRSDPTIAPYLHNVPFENLVVDTEYIRHTIDGVEMENDHVIVVHAPTKTGLKGTDTFVEAMEAFPDVEFRIIMGHSWDETLREKAKCHIMLDTISNEGYGMNDLESLVMGHEVVTNLDPWSYALHPELPITSFWGKGDLVERIRIEMKEAIERVKLEENWNGGEAWVEKNFGLKTAAKRWSAYMRWLSGTD